VRVGVEAWDVALGSPERIVPVQNQPEGRLRYGDGSRSDAPAALSRVLTGVSFVGSLATGLSLADPPFPQSGADLRTCRGDRVQHPDALPSEIAARGQSQDVPVVPFDLPEASAEEFIRHAFSRISVRLVTQPLHDHALVVTEPRT
jgi:hypothetical protein